ncbi:MAG TPA: DUF6142 family protein [Gemmataceae bacterium]|nr:DUF6142 family protein [Gemmataceae bacterium]
MIFISYRREDSKSITGQIYDRLVAHFGAKSVFKDVDSIPLGVDFRRALQRAVGQCAIVVVVIGDSWLQCKDDFGRRRLDQADDFVRLEIETALQRNIPVIPLLVGHAPIPNAMQLPKSLQDLSFRNGLQIRSTTDFDEDIRQLIRYCKKTMSARSAGEPNIQSRSTKSPGLSTSEPDGNRAADDRPRAPRTEKLPNSGLGIISMIIGVAVGVLALMNLLVAALLAQQGVSYLAASVIGVIGLTLNLVGAGFGLVGLMRSNQKKQFAIAGLSINGLLFVGTILLFCCGGLAMK